MSEDNRFLAIVETRRDSLPEKKKGANWDFFAITCKAKPHCRIVYCDLQTGSFHTVLEDDCWFGHAQIRPGDPDTIMFCHEGVAGPERREQLPLLQAAAFGFDSDS